MRWEDIIALGSKNALKYIKGMFNKKRLLGSLDGHLRFSIGSCSSVVVNDDLSCEVIAKDDADLYLGEALERYNLVFDFDKKCTVKVYTYDKNKERGSFIEDVNNNTTDIESLNSKRMTVELHVCGAMLYCPEIIYGNGNTRIKLVGKEDRLNMLVVSSINVLEIKSIHNIMLFGTRNDTTIEVDISQEEFEVIKRVFSELGVDIGIERYKKVSLILTYGHEINYNIPRISVCDFYTKRERELIFVEDLLENKEFIDILISKQNSWKGKYQDMIDREVWAE